MNLADLRHDKFRGSSVKLPMCQMLLTKGKAKETGFESSTAVLFVKSESIKLSGWINDGTGLPYTHTYNGGKKDTGIAFTTPRLHIVKTSPRLIEVTEKGSVNAIGRKGQILGNYESPEGQAIRYQHPKEYTTLRTLYMVFLIGAGNSLLHKVPLVLSIHGGGAAILGNQLNLFYRQLEVVYSDHENAAASLNNIEEQFYTLNEEARAIAIFEPHLDVATVGEEQTSDIPAFVSYKEPTLETLSTIFNFANADKIWACQKPFANFAESYLKQFEQFHPVEDIGSLQLGAAFPPFTQDAIAVESEDIPY